MSIIASTILFLSALSIATAQPKSLNLTRGSSLSPSGNSSSLLSQSGLFAFGFFPFGDGYSISIWFEGTPQKTVVWTANRNDPPLSRNANIVFKSDGRLILQELGGQEKSIANTTQPAVLASMLDSGNFVLFASNSTIIWQSFDHPTDTLLPSQLLRARSQLVSSSSETNHSVGIFRIKMQNDGNIVLYQYAIGIPIPDAPEYSYWAAVTNFVGANATLTLDENGRLYMLDSTGVNLKNITTGRIPSDGKKYRATIDADGIFRLYSHDLNGNGNWSIEWLQPGDACAPKGICGINAYCDLKNQKAFCTCPAGFVFINQEQMNLGCNRNFTAESCSSKNEDTKYDIQEFQNSILDDSAYGRLFSPTKEECKQACLEDCNCQAAFFQDQECRKQKLPLMFWRWSTTPQVGGYSNATFVKFGRGIDAQEKGDSGQHKGRLLVIVLTTTATVVLLLGLVICCLRKRRLKLKGMVVTSKESESKINHMAAAGDFNGNVPNLQVFILADIEAATNRYSIENKLGQGGYGPVFKGVLPNGQEIAVKKLSKTSTQGFEEFKNEVLLTAKLQHVNLVRLLGFCNERNEQMLIYEYMPNKSLDFYLFDPMRRYLLDWTKCVDIIEGITQGLLYLQEYSRMTIIHRDLKASNILLDEEMKPKISDFGMARIFRKDDHEANTSRIVGTYGYIPPEYARKGMYSTKSDVYSFGVLLLQIISGKRTACYYGLDEELNILEYAYELWKEGKGMKFMDSTLDDALSSCKLIRCMQIALLCVQENARDRPSMLEVYSMLKNETAALTTPKQPAFSRKTDEEEENKSTLQPKICSHNDATISELVAR